MNTQIVLILAVAAVGVLHTLVPDHWVPIALLAREHGWTGSQTARAAFGAGAGHVLSTLVIGLAVWFAGVAFAARFGNELNLVSSFALIAFGLWIAVGSIVDLRREHAAHHLPEPAVEQSYDKAIPVPAKHRHLHHHEGGVVHVHTHAHAASAIHEVTEETDVLPPLHFHEHKASGRSALLLILGSSPMVEGIPAFFAASKYGVGLIALMAVVFGAATIATYVALCVYSAQRLAGVSIGPFERYGEVLSGAVIAAIGAAFLFWPPL